jgi:formylmethanofuran dehydrogenase subunit B
MTSHTSVPCPVCGCACDDLSVTTDGGRVVSTVNACGLAKPWFARQNTFHPPAAEIDGQPAEPAVAFDRAAEILKNAKYPLIYGLHRSTSAGVRAAAALADRLGATIDVADPGLAPAVVAMQEVGESTCTLGEVKQRADLVIFWGCDPARTHPRLIERYCPPRPGRTFVVMDESETETAKTVDLVVKLTPGREWEALWQLRILVAKNAPNPPTPFPKREGGDDLSPSPLRGGVGEGLSLLSKRMTACRFGVVFFGDGLTGGSSGHCTVAALFQLVIDLNRVTRFYALPLRPHTHGADSVFTSQFGYPLGVNLAAGYPRYNPGEFTGADVLARKEADACLLVGGDAVQHLSADAVDHLRRIPVVLLDGPESMPPMPTAVRITTAVAGIHTTGSIHRLDGVVLPVRPILPTQYPDDAAVLAQILRRIGVTDSPGRAVNPTARAAGGV